MVITEDTDCRIKHLVNFQKMDFDLPTELDLSHDPFEEGDIIIFVPLLIPWPFCTRTFFNVDYELREDVRKLTKWEHPWITYTSEERILRISS